MNALARTDLPLTRERVQRIQQNLMFAVEADDPASMNDPSLEVSSSLQDPCPVGAIVADRYALRRVLGRGGAAVVFAAEHVLVRRPVALKLPLRNPELTELLAARLRCETQALARVRHPAIVDVIDAGEAGSMPYVAMELLEGRTLSGLIAARGRLASEDVIKIGVALAEGLAATHAADVIHRDVKPANVLITLAAHNQIHLCDFGIARVRGPHATLDQKLTQAGAILGTPEYMSMEAFVNGSDADERVDMFALGITLFECLTGAVPVEGALGSILRHRSQHTGPSLTDLRPDVLPPLAAVVARCLAPDPNGRYDDMTQLAAALRACTKKPLEALDLLRSGTPAVVADGARPSAAHAPVSKNAATDGGAVRRTFARAPYVTLATLQRAGGPSTDARIEDVSEGGVLLVTREPYKMNEPVRLRFAMPISGRVFTVNAVVRWSRNARGAPATGVEFGELPDAARNEVRQYVALMGNAGPHAGTGAHASVAR
jgi:serine/threonine protein kinase